MGGESGDDLDDGNVRQLTGMGEHETRKGGVRWSVDNMQS